MYLFTYPTAILKELYGTLVSHYVFCLEQKNCCITKHADKYTITPNTLQKNKPYNIKWTHSFKDK